MGNRQGAGRREGASPRERAAGTHRVEQDAVLLVLLGVQHVITVGRGRSEARPEANPHCFSTPAAQASPFLAESNTHEAGLVGPVGFHSEGASELSALAPARYGPREGSYRVAAPKWVGDACACWLSTLRGCG